jgi:hypothetical protein
MRLEQIPSRQDYQPWKEKLTRLTQEIESHPVFQGFSKIWPAPVDSGRDFLLKSGAVF